MGGRAAQARADVRGARRGVLGLARVAELELRYVELPAFAEQTVTIQVHVDVVPDDRAAGRIPDLKVRTELLLQQVQGEKRRAADALRDGDHASARRAYEAAGAQLGEGMLACPSDEIAEEREVIGELRLRLDAGDAEWAAKFSRADQARKSRKRGRGDRRM